MCLFPNSTNIENLPVCMMRNCFFFPITGTIFLIQLSTGILYSFCIFCANKFIFILLIYCLILYAMFTAVRTTEQKTIIEMASVHRVPLPRLTQNLELPSISHG